MTNMLNKFKKAQTKISQPADVEALLKEAANMLDAHEGVEHVNCIEHLFGTQAIKALKEEGVLEAGKFYSRRQAASHIWLLWRQM